MFNLLEKVKETTPLVVHFTNEVTINDCANITLAIGASPIMSSYLDDLEDIVKIASSIVVNIGTINRETAVIFKEVAKFAKQYNKKIVLDPVGVFATAKRFEYVKELLGINSFSVIKGNIAEIKAIGGIESNGQGVDSLDNEINIEQIKNLSKKLDTVLAITGKTDYITDGERVFKIENGTSKLKQVTGTGCMSASLIASYIAVTNSVLEGATMGVLTMGICGELAEKDGQGIGSFKVALMDEISLLNKDKINDIARIEEV
ncbi:MAG: hydroxyethylthiazole kinase [Sarcina sp.]